MLTGLRFSAGMMFLGAAVAGGVPGLSSLDAPIEVLGGSALISTPRPEPTTSGGLIWMLAALAQDDLPPPPPVGEPVKITGRIAPPSFSLIEIAPDGTIRFEGRGTPGTRVTLNRHGEPFASALVTQKGDWSVTLDSQIGSGVHVFSSIATKPSNGTPIEGGDVRIAIPREFGAQAAPSAPSAGQQGADAVRRRAEDIAREANEEFSRIEKERRVAQGGGAAGQGSPAKPAPREPDGEKTEGGGILFWLQDWLASANRDFQGKIMRRLQIPGPESEEAEARAKAAAAEQERRRKEAAEAAARQQAERLANERAAKAKAEAEAARLAAEQKKREDEKRAAATADARDAEAARQAETQRQAAEQAQRQSEAQRAAEEQRQREAQQQAEAARRAAAEADQRRRQQEAVEASRRQAEAAARSAEDATAARERDRRLREERERALLAAEVEERRRRAEARARLPREPERPAAPAPVAKPPVAKPPVAKVAKPAPATTSQTTRLAPRPGLRGGDGTPDAVDTPNARQESEAARASTGRRDPRGPDGHVMPEGWRRLADLSARRSGEPVERRSRPVADGDQLRGQRTASARAAPARDATRVLGVARRAGDGACPKAGRQIRLPGTYVVRTGDNLWAISRRHYRLGKYWTVIYHANGRKISDPDLIYPCQRFHLPTLRRHR